MYICEWIYGNMSSNCVNNKYNNIFALQLPLWSNTCTKQDAFNNNNKKILLPCACRGQHQLVSCYSGAACLPSFQKILRDHEDDKFMNQNFIQYETYYVVCFFILCKSIKVSVSLVFVAQTSATLQSVTVWSLPWFPARGAAIPLKIQK